MLTKYEIEPESSVSEGLGDLRDKLEEGRDGGEAVAEVAHQAARQEVLYVTAVKEILKRNIKNSKLCFLLWRREKADILSRQV